MSAISLVLVEDDFLVRMVAADALRDHGIEVREAEHAEDALGILRACASTVHVLATDINMPGTIDGLALAHMTSHSWRWIGILIMSGRPRPHPRDMPARSWFLAKPYSHEDLHRHVRNLANVSRADLPTLRRDAR